MSTYDYDPRTGGNSYTLIASVGEKLVTPIKEPMPNKQAARNNLRGKHELHASTPRPENSL